MEKYTVCKYSIKFCRMQFNSLLMTTVEKVGLSQSMKGLKSHKEEFSGVEEVKNQGRLPIKECPFLKAPYKSAESSRHG